VDQQAERRELYNGFGNALSLSIEFALGPVIFGGLGWLLDRALGTRPVLLVALALVGVVASFLRMWFHYDAEMKTQEASAIWNTHASVRKAGVGSASDLPAPERSTLLRSEA
jgi:F0F1-type ATP synthase assembly protein I